MTREVSEQQQRNRSEQTRLYGAPLGELLAEATQVMGLTQSRIAALLGLSAPMVSQLCTGHRVKIGNPAAMARLQRLLGVCEEVREGQWEISAAVELLERERDAHVLTTRTSQITPRRGASEVQRLLRSVASPEELLHAAGVLDAEHPALAEILRVYGAGRSADALAHYERTLPG